MIEFPFNSDDLADIGHACDMVRGLRGSGKKYRLTLTQLRERRKDAQNRLYWVGYVQPFNDWLRGQGNDHFTGEMAHEVLKHMFLRESVMNPVSGEVMTYTRSTTDLDPDEFGEYLEKCGAFFATECGMKGYGSNRNQFDAPTPASKGAA